MVATRSKNLRSGDFAEELGLLLIRQFALITPVPRTEDVGIDAVVTLVKNFNGYSILAEDNFFLQIKSANNESIEYVEHQVNWLYELELPFFVAIVDRKKSSIKLFCAHRLSNAFITNHKRKKLVLHFKKDLMANELVDKDDENIYLGCPVLEWSIDTIEEDVSFKDTFYQVIKEHVNLYKKNLQSQKVGLIDLIHWKTNTLPKKFGEASAFSRGYAEHLELAEKSLEPYLGNWIRMMQLENKFSPMAESVLSLMNKVRKTISLLEQQKSNDK